MNYPYDETQEQIRASIISRMGDTVSTNEGSFGDLMPRAVSYEIWRFYQQLYALIGIAFPDATSGIYLEKRCAEYGIKRKEAGFATVVLTFKGSSGTQIPINTTVQTTDGLSFNTIAAIKIPTEGYIDVTAKASAAGAEYNVQAGKVTKLLTQINGVSSVNNASPASGGFDAETDEDLFNRLNILRQSRATSGNAAQYEEWALEVEGVGAARCKEVWDGPNTVLVVIASADLTPVDEDIVENVKNYIETKRPVGAIVTVKSAEAVTLNISAQIELEDEAQLESVKRQFTAAIKEYLKNIAWRSDNVIYARVLYLLLGITGVADYKSLTINDQTQNIPLTDTNVPTIGEVNILEST